jgi:hypothetical protein
MATPIVFDAPLWQAARETVDFLPLIATDPIAGTIQTDWGSPRGKPTEQYRIAVAVNYACHDAGVTVQRQILGPDGWWDAPDPSVAAGLRRDIARYAQELRKGQIAGN